MTAKLGRPKKTSDTPPTPRQQAIAEWVKQHILTQGYAPSVREIGAQFDISSPNGVTQHLKALERKGVMKRATNKKGRVVARAYIFPRG